MYMRDLACCANGMAFYSTPSDLVRFALATNPGSVNGELAGGMVMSLMMGRDSGIVIAVTSNMAHANTSSLAQRVGDAFAKQEARARKAGLWSESDPVPPWQYRHGPKGGPVKKSKSRICHAPESASYQSVKNFTAFPTLDACLASGGRLPKQPGN